uniref:Uncharacterized protein n=1 Tax=Anguilla anguilla TaxID=7936 RepID=A0A0E9TL19_ANGAN
MCSVRDSLLSITTPRFLVEGDGVRMVLPREIERSERGELRAGI